MSTSPRKFLLAPALAVLVLGGLAALAARALPVHSAYETYDGRQMIVHVPGHMPAAGSRALVVVLHGGLGNADAIENGRAERGMDLDTVADRDGFIVAYLNGTPVTRLLGERFKGWNAGGGCCGVPAQTGVDDVAYIKGAVDQLARRYGIDHARVYAIGHSNGAMMAQRMACETRVFSAVVAISGPLNLPVASCPAAKGTRVLAIHGADDRNVPIAGGRGSLSFSRIDYVAEDRSRQVFTRSGATYTLDVLPGVDHFLDHIAMAIRRTDGMSLADKAAAFFGLGAAR
ncbi:MAG: alpha/beta hydrolase family esterase [Caulobacteraceae bacterium]